MNTENCLVECGLVVLHPSVTSPPWAWGILSSTAKILLMGQTTAIYITQVFLSAFPLFFHIVEFKNLFLSVVSSFCSFLCSFLLFLFILLFFSALFSISCFVLFLSVYSRYFLISLIVFFSNLLSFSFFLLLCVLLM